MSTTGFRRAKPATPGILAEISFITNQQEAALLKTDKYKQQIAEALFAGVLRYQQP